MSASDASTSSSISTLLSSHSARTGALALLGSAALVLSFRSLSRNGGKGSSNRRGREDEQDVEQEERRTRRDEAMPALRQRSSSAMSEMGSGKNSVAIFWDVDNCTPPTGSSGYTVAQAIRRAAQSTTQGKSTSSIVSFKAYLELSTEGAMTPAAQVNLRSELQGSGVSLIDTPKSGRKDVADKMMITDLLSFAIDKRPPALIVLLSGDRDFAYPLGVLRNRGYEVLLITPPVGAAPILEASANHVMRWRQDVLGVDRDGQGRLYDRPKTSKGVRVDGPEASIASPSKGPKPIQQPSQSQSQVPQKSAPASVLKGPGAPPSVPEVFQPLVTLLEKLRKQGNPRPLRSACAPLLLKTDKTVYERAGANRWADYVAVAEAAGIVILGDNRVPGSEWIALRSIDDSKTVSKKSNISNITTAAPPTVTSSAAPTSSTPSSQTHLADVNLQIFFPLIEVCKALRGSTNGGFPIASQVAAQLEGLHSSRTKDLGIEQGVYWQAKVKNFAQYLDLAERAGVARLRDYTAPGGGPTQQTVQIHPKSERLYTGTIVSPATPGVVNGDSSNSNIKENDEPSTSTKGDGAFLYAHQPSGERINVDYFPLANLLISQRREGKLTSTEGFVGGIMAKNFRSSQFCNTKEGFAKYLARAQKDDIVQVVEGPLRQRLIILSEWLRDPAEKSSTNGSAPAMTRSTSSSKDALTNGKKSSSRDPAASVAAGTSTKEGEAGQDDESNWVDEDSGNSTDGMVQAQDEQETKSVEENDAEPMEEGVTSPLAPLPSVEVKPATKEDRARFKPLVETLVHLRREMNAQDPLKRRVECIAPLRSRVSAEMVRLNSPSSQQQPGAWYQSYGVGGFEEYAQQAQEKGFVVSLDGTKKRIRLSRKYESMFFSHEIEEAADGKE